jgi:serine/threonine-protein kinase
MAKVWHPDGTPAQSTLPDATLDEEEDLSLTGQSRLQGTVAYMSPEQITMDPGIDYRTDTFSLGAILYEILSGHTPSVGLSVDEIVHKTLKEDPPKPSTLTELEVPEPLEHLCMRCLAKDPDERPAHMREVLEELQAD